MVIVRFDYVLRNRSDELINNLESDFGNPKNKLNNADIRENVRRDLTFVKKDPAGVFNSFDSLSIRAIESTSSVTEIISIARVSKDVLVDVAFDEQQDSRQFTFRSWRKDLEYVRRWIPGEEQGPETTIYWVDVPRLPQAIRTKPFSPTKAQAVFQDGVAAQFLQDFEVSANRGAVTFENEQLMFLGKPDRMFGHSLVLDISQQVSHQGWMIHNPAFTALDLPNSFSVLSSFFATHYWCASRGKEIDEIKEELKDAKSELPIRESPKSPDEYLKIEPRIHQVQEKWATLHGNIPGEQRELKRRLNRANLNYEDTDLRSAPADESGERPGVLEAYISSLERQLEQVQFDEKQVDDYLDSLSEFFDNQLSAMATRENIGLQRRVYLFTILVAILTIALLFDAIMTGGLSTFVDLIFARGVSGVSHQAWFGSVAILAIIIFWTIFRIDG